MEVWKDIPGYEGRYQASTEGRIRSINRVIKTMRGSRRYEGRVLSPGAYCKSGHVSVVLGHHTSGIPVHKLILLTFIGKRPNSDDIRHKNGNPKDNRLSNLTYGSRTENILDVFRQGKKWRKLSEEDAIYIKQALTKGIKGKVLAKCFGVSEAAISAIKLGKTFWWVGELDA